MIFNQLLKYTSLITLFSGCALPIVINPPPVDVQITQLCIIRNPKVLMKGFLPELEAQIKSHGITTFVYTAYDPERCQYWLDYTANWHWDFLMYMNYAELNLYDHTALIGRAVFDNTGIGPQHYGSAPDKLKALTVPLFARHSNEIKTVTHFD